MNDKITYTDVVEKQNYREKCIFHKGSECGICGNSDNIEVHHIDGDRYNNSLDNLMPVCSECHNKIHTYSSDELSEWSKKVKTHKDRKSFATDKEIGEEMNGLL